MSTYLKSAAMSLLSKTLQTFLTKYLSEVDVEGVTLPSYDGSGWGVTLSNVHLREGVQLMKTMPGTVTKKRKVKRKRMVKRKLKPKDTKEKSTQAQSRSKDGLVDDGKMPPAYRRSRTNSTMSVEDLDIPVPTATDYFTDTDDEIEVGDSGDVRPLAGAQAPRSMFSCFRKRDTSKGNQLTDHSLHAGKQDQELNFDTEVTVKEELNDIADSEKTTSGFENTENHSYEAEVEYEYYEEEEEYEEELELPLQLCLGEHGRIGMVDVRQIGKELHIMVEDAVVTIDAIPILKNDDNTGKNGGSNMESSQNNLENETNNDDEKASVDGDGDDTATETEKSTKKPKLAPKRDTVGDRVLADNGLARLISSIPHLFLRDVCVQLIVRDEPMTADTEDTGNATNVSNATTENNGVNGYTKPRSSSNDTMVEVGIDFLSVTSGEDILSHFQQEHTTMGDDLQNSNSENDIFDSSKKSANSMEDSMSTRPPSLLKIPSNFVDANGEQNEFLIRHIRTGRGPSAGISVQLFVPNSGISKIVNRSTASSGDVWARQHWITSTQNCLLKCSGLDIQARIYMGTKSVDAGYSWFYGEYVEDEEGSSEIDSMILFGSGMDAIAPGSQISFPPPPRRVEPAPPIERNMSRGNTPAKKSFERIVEETSAGNSDVESLEQPTSSMHPGVDAHHIDANGIQSCKVPSSFHRVSRGMVLKSCKDCNQLPSEVSDLCWEVPPDSNVKKDSSLDSSIPMPGLAFQISIRDPLEINVDRNSIETIGLVKSLFTKPSYQNPIDDEKVKEESEINDNNSSEIVPSPSLAEDSTQATTASTGFFSGLLYGKKEETIYEEEVSKDSFETCMQPESISVMGIYLAETIFRVHVMREDENDRNLSFCYWQVETHCLTIDRQTLNSQEKSFSDLKLDIGRLVWDEYRGTSKTRLVSLGVHEHFEKRQPHDSSTSVSSMIDDHANNKAPWPSTACALLDIPPPVECLPYKSREGHGLQLRFISTPSNNQLDLNQVSRSTIYLRLGLATVDSNWAIKDDISLTIREILRNLASRKKDLLPATEDRTDNEEQKDQNSSSKLKEEKEKESKTVRSLMTYTIQVDSGNISLPPLIQVKMPITRFSGERSSIAGFSIESELGKVELAYGSKEKNTSKRSPLLPLVAGLPESVRMHILLCLKELSPLELALNVKKEKNSFRRIKAIDKAILKMAKKITKRSMKSTSKKKLLGNSHTSSSRLSFLDAASRRQHIFTEIMKLDDDELTNLWSVHQRYQKKLAKKLREEQNDGKET